MTILIQGLEDSFNKLHTRFNELEQSIKNQQKNQLLNVDEVCKLTGLAKQTIYQKVNNGTMPYLKVGRSLRFRRSDLMNWIENKENKMNINN